jgi:hypothetical protein
MMHKKNPYNYMQADHVAPYHVWETIAKLEDALAELDKGMEEVCRGGASPFTEDAVWEMGNFRGKIQEALDRACSGKFSSYVPTMEQELIRLWNKHMGGGS